MASLTHVINNPDMNRALGIMGTTSKDMIGIRYPIVE